MTSAPELRRARLDPTLRATLSAMTPLAYAGGANAEADHPAHVRAASGIRSWGESLVIVQDDTNVLAMRRSSGAVHPLLLPRGEGGRRVFEASLGTKHAKLDLEACVTLPDGRLLALGSGSTERREQLALLRAGERAQLRDGSALYAALRAAKDFSGSELNVEGAAIVGGTLLRLFQRGNGAPRDGLVPVHASCDFELEAFFAWLDHGAPVPELRAITHYDLGGAAGVAYGFTDAVSLEDGRVAFLAGAEDSPDTFRDGAVVGCAFGVIDDREVRMTLVLEPDGTPSVKKLEGIELLASGAQHRFAVVSDPDAAELPAELGTLVVAGLERPVMER